MKQWLFARGRAAGRSASAHRNTVGLRKLRFAALIMGFALAGCSGLLPPPISRFELQTPRPFGYLIGDEIRHRIVVETRRDMKFNPGSVPARGEINRWLNLNEVTVNSDQESGNTVIELTYQVFYAPNEVKMLSIPGFDLQFIQAGKAVEQAVPAWPFTLSPLKELAVRKDEAGHQYMRPDALPAPLSAQSQWLGFYAGLSLFLLIGAYLTFLYGYFPAWPQRRIFKKALSRINRLPSNELETGLVMMHQAFNVLYGKPLFRHQLSAFYIQYPQYRDAASQIDWFFALSNSLLFGGRRSVVSDEDWRKLLDLCGLCREIECDKR